MYKIYLLNNPFNDKNYVGCTGNTPEARWANGRGYSENKELFSDILMYGWQNFTKEILAETPDKEEADWLEEKFIEQFNAYTDGYNKNPGGGGKPKKAVAQYDIAGDLVAVYPSIMEAERVTGVPNSNIAHALAGLLKTTGGSYWKYASEK